MIKLEDINLEELQDLSYNEQIKIKIDIINSLDLLKIPSSFLPSVHSEDYYFISYAHRDYKRVYPDLFGFEKYHFDFWYDLGIAAGANWVDIANKYIVPYACKGVIFYISEASLSSESVYEEIKFVQDIDKPFICIHLPITSDYYYEGESVKGQTFPISKMLDIMLANGVELDPERVKNLKKMFPDELLFLALDMHPETKIQKIKAYIRKVPILTFSNDHKTLLFANDTNATVIKKEDFPYHQELDDRRIIIYMGKASFANLRVLEEINFPDKYGTFFNSYAFYNCHRLKRINVNHPIEFMIYEGTFYNCYSLETISLNPNSISNIESYAFYGCKNLKFDFSKFEILYEISTCSFSYCASLDKLDFHKNLQSIRNFAFEHCSGLETINLNMVKEVTVYAFDHCSNISSFSVAKNNKSFSSEDGVIYSKDLKTVLFYPTVRDYIKLRKGTKVIGDEVFSYMHNLKEAFIPEGIEEIGVNVFTDCPHLGIVHFPSTIKKIGGNLFGFADGHCKLVFNLNIKDLKKVSWTSLSGFTNEKEVLVKCLDGEIIVNPRNEKEVFTDIIPELKKSLRKANRRRRKMLK